MQTRIRKLQTTDLDAIILARAGLERLGLADTISIVFDPKQFIPAPAQGALAIQTRSDDKETVEIVQIPGRPSGPGAGPGRAAGSRHAASAVVTPRWGPMPNATGEAMEIHAFIADVEGRNIIRKQAEGPVSQAVSVGRAAWPRSCSMPAAGRFFGNWKGSKAKVNSGPKERAWRTWWGPDPDGRT